MDKRLFLKKKLRMAAVMTALAALPLVAACGSARREVLMREKYPYYPEHIREAIDGGYLVEGMDKEQVILALGTTWCKKMKYYKGRSTEVWGYDSLFYSSLPVGVYLDCKGVNYRVYFEEGKVVGWKQSNFTEPEYDAEVNEVEN